MVQNKPKSIEIKISRLTREISQIDKFFYRSSENEDRSLYAGMLERKRDDMVRSVVLQMHTAIEDILNSLITCCILDVKPESKRIRMRSNAGRALAKMLSGAGSIGFDTKLNFAMALGLLNARTKERLTELIRCEINVATIGS